MIDQDILQAILSQIADGSSMREACATHGINRRAFFQAVNESEEVANHYARAMEMGCEALADGMRSLAAEARGKPNEEVQAIRLQLDADKWLLSKRYPRRYGDKVTQELVGANGGPLSTSVTVSYVVPAALSVQPALVDKSDDCV